LKGPRRHVCIHTEKREITATTQAIRKIITIHQLSQKRDLRLGSDVWPLLGRLDGVSTEPSSQLTLQPNTGFNTIR
jgi:hypothetical protein